MHAFQYMAMARCVSFFSCFDFSGSMSTWHLTSKSILLSRKVLYASKRYNHLSPSQLAYGIESDQGDLIALFD